MISRVSEQYKRKVDVVVYDALACNSIWINHLINLNIDTVVRVKKNNNRSLRHAKRMLNKSEPVEVWNDENQKCIRVYESLFEMSNVKEPLRLVKFATKNSDGSRSQIMIATTLMETSLKTLYKMIKARWNIENSIFNNMKSEYHLDHCCVQLILGKAKLDSKLIMGERGSYTQFLVRQGLLKVFNSTTWGNITEQCIL